MRDTGHMAHSAGTVLSALLNHYIIDRDEITSSTLKLSIAGDQLSVCKGSGSPKNPLRRNGGTEKCRLR